MAKIKGLRWWMIGLIMLGSVINYLTRSSLAVAAPTLLHDLHITEKRYSLILGAFPGAIMAQPICGYVMDVLGLKIGFAIFAIAWSLVNMAHALAGTWQAFAFLRGLLGFSEGSANPAGMKATAEWFPARERCLAGGLFNTGALVGSMLAPFRIEGLFFAWPNLACRKYLSRVPCCTPLYFYQDIVLFRQPLKVVPRPQDQLARLEAIAHQGLAARAPYGGLHAVGYPGAIRHRGDAMGYHA